MDKIKEKIFQAIGYKPWPTQLRFHESEARFKALFAGARYGKSKSGAYEVLPDILKKDTRGWIVGPSYEQTSKEFRYLYDALVVKMRFKPLREINARYTAPGPQMLHFPWGAEVITKSEENPDSLLGEELDWLILSEASRQKEGTYDQYLRARLGTRKGRVVVPTTPHGYNWLYKRFYIPSTEGDADYWSDIVSVIENPLFPKEDYYKAKEELPEEIFLEQYDGQFVSYTGLIYKRFQRKHNVIEPIKLKDNWVRYMAIDPHPQTPCAIIWIAIDEYGTFYAYDEMFIPNLTIPEIADRIKGREGKLGENIRRLIDPNAKYIDKLRGQTMSVKQQFAREGIYCVEANNKFESAYYRINELLSPKRVYGSDTHRPTLFVFNTMKELIHEFEVCSWENEKENHLLDGLKYIVNDNPMRTWREEEKDEFIEEEKELVMSMNRITGY